MIKVKDQMIFFLVLLKLVQRRPLRFRRDISTICKRYVRIKIDQYMSLIPAYDDPRTTSLWETSTN